MYVCDHCGKGSQVGMNVSHSHVRTKKRSKPNLHRTTLVYDGRRQSMRLCTKCLRLAKKKSVVGYNVEAKGGKDGVIQTSSSSRAEGVKLKKKESHTLSEDIMKAATSTKKEPAKTSNS